MTNKERATATAKADAGILPLRVARVRMTVVAGVMTVVAGVVTVVIGVMAQGWME